VRKWVVRALLAAITCQKGDVEANLAAHRAALNEATRADCEVVVFPEFSLTGSVDPRRCPTDTVTIDSPVVGALVEMTSRMTAVFGLSERSADEFFITQAIAQDGRLVGAQRKRHLGEDEHGYAISDDSTVVDVGGRRAGIIICAEAGVDWTWDATANAGADIVLFCAAPGLYDRRTDAASWREGFDWWKGCCLGDACRHAKRLGVWVAVATQTGSTVDEDFPGLAALISPEGTVVDQLPDWRSGTLVVDIPD
jgi:predicted amidohydrolase